VGPNAVRYQLIVQNVDTVFRQIETVLQIRMIVRSQEGRAVVAAAVDFGVTEGIVDPARTTMAPDGTVTATWTIPPGPLVANLYGCARPISQSCSSGPLFKWNQ